MNLGAEPKKVAILGCLLVAGAVGLYMNLGGNDTSPPAPRAVPSGFKEHAPVAGASTGGSGRARGGGRVGGSEFRPRQGSARPEDRVDPASIDPELKLDLLAKVQATEPFVAGRNLFQFSTAPAPDKPMPVLPKDVPKIPIGKQNQPPQPAAVAGGPRPAPPASPITLKYYGYRIAKSDGHKVAFLLDGEDIIFAGENETVKQRYRIVRIALNSIVIEDTQAKSTQTLPLLEMTGLGGNG